MTEVLTVEEIPNFESVLTQVLSKADAKEFLEFKTLPVYGTIDSPLFPADLIAKIIGIKNVRQNFGKWQKKFPHTINTMVKKIKIKTKKYPINALTQKGLIVLLTRSDTSMCDTFANFVDILLTELDKYGQVTKENAMRQLTERAELERAENAKLRDQLTLQKQYGFIVEQKLETAEKKTASLLEQYGDPADPFDVLDVIIDSEKAVSYQVKKRFMRPIHVYVVDPKYVRNARKNKKKTDAVYSEDEDEKIAKKSKAKSKKEEQKGQEGHNPGSDDDDDLDVAFLDYDPPLEEVAYYRISSSRYRIDAPDSNSPLKGKIRYKGTGFVHNGQKNLNILIDMLTHAGHATVRQNVFEISYVRLMEMFNQSFIKFNEKYPKAEKPRVIRQAKKKARLTKSSDSDEESADPKERKDNVPHNMEIDGASDMVRKHRDVIVSI